MRQLVWQPEAWDDYLYWQKTDKKIFKRLNLLIKETLREPASGIGKPEPLKANLSGAYSRRINRMHRLVYMHDDQKVIILQCRYHYE